MPFSDFPEIYRKIHASYHPKKKAGEERNLFVSAMRRLSFFAAVPFAWMGIGPNTVTVIGFVIAIAAAILLALGSSWLPLGGALILVSYLFDFIDGNLARTFQQTTHFGKFIDSITGAVSYPIWILGLGFGIEMHLSELPLASQMVNRFGHWIILVMTGISIIAIMLETFIPARYFHIKLENKLENKNVEVTSQVAVTSTHYQRAQGWRSIPLRYELVFYQLWFPTWFFLCLFNRPFLLLSFSFFATVILIVLNSGRYFLKARTELNVHRIP